MLISCVMDRWPESLNKAYLLTIEKAYSKPLVRNAVYLRNEFHFSDVYRSVNYIGLRAK